MLSLLGALWALPITLIGWLVALVTWSKPIERVEVTAVLFRTGPWLSRLMGDTWAGFCVGDAVFLAPKWVSHSGVRAHELRHKDQVHVFGPTMPLFYAVGWLVSAYRWERTRVGPLWWEGFYRLNPFEVDARKAAEGKS